MSQTGPLLVPPSNPEAERAIIASAIISPEAARWAVEHLSSRDFYSDKNSAAFDAIVSLLAEGIDPDIVAMADRLRKAGKFGDMGGMDYFKAVMSSVATADHIKHYADIILRCACERDMIRHATALQEAVRADDSEARDAALDAIGKAAARRELVGSPAITSMSDAVHGVLDELEKGKTTTIATGLHIDAKIDGLERGDLMTVGARTGVGKTALLLAIARNMAKAGLRVAYFAGEMTERQVAMRALSAESSIPHWRLRKRQIRGDWTSINSAAGRLADLSIFFCSEPSPDIQAIRAFSDAAQADVIFVDYLTRCTMPRAENMRVGVNKFMQALKNMARSTGRVVILAAQINRMTDRLKAEPVLADLKESGAIEEESDAVVLLSIVHDDEYKAQEAQGIIPNTVTIRADVAKNRHGQTGFTDLRFEREFVRVGDSETVVDNPPHPALPMEAEDEVPF